MIDKVEIMKMYEDVLKNNCDITVNSGVDSSELMYLRVPLNVLRLCWNEKDKAKEAYKNRLKNIDDVYGKGSKGQVQYYKVAEEEYKELISTLQVNAREACRQSFADIRLNLEKHITSVIPEETQKQIDYLKEYGTKVTDTERDLIIDRCKNNYKAIRIINEHYITPKLALISYEEMKNTLDELQRLILDCINDVGGEYRQRLALYGEIEKSADDDLKVFFGMERPLDKIEN